jgi:hypothetical protein
MNTPFDLIYKYINDPDDFRMPYVNYGRTDLEVMQEKYRQLTIYPRNYLERRFIVR